MSLIDIRGARVRFDDGGAVALPDLSIGDGDRVSVVGPNGSGKSTLLRVIARVLAAEGDVRFDVTRGEIGWVPQRPFLFRVSVQANVELALRRGGVPRDERRRRAAEALESTGASALAARTADNLSEGERTRVAVARALVVRPRLLLLDEVFAPLDADGVRVVGAAIRRDAATAIVFASPAEISAEWTGPVRVVRL